MVTDWAIRRFAVYGLGVLALLCAALVIHLIHPGLV